MDRQERVAAFVDEQGWKTDLAYRVLDLQSEVGEIADEVTTTTDYGASPAEARVAVDEVGHALFALLAVAESAGVDADEALDTAIAKYERRIAETGDGGSGE
ncbi:MazG-like family protein [Halorubrum tibetense]|uniref:MazG-like family protein n=1 Tax=Halorubrum tibetense TaxID=175631 RepID=A0ABD5SDK9_9EURY